MSQLRFVALDVETANSKRGSICAIAVARVVDGMVADERLWMCRPPAGIDDFLPQNVRLHKITPESVENEPRFGDLWPEIYEYIGGNVVIGHNAAFDTSSIREACTASDIPWPELTYGCSMVLGRQAFPDLKGHGLAKLTEHCGVPLVNHHNPVHDARATAEVVIKMDREHGGETIHDLADSLKVDLGWINAERYRSCRKGGNDKAKAWFSGREEVLEPSPARTGPLEGQTVVFTGALDGYTRQEAMDVAAAAGAVARTGVTKSTTILVTGYSASRTSKESKALEMRSSGKSIEIIDEAEFLDRLGIEKKAPDTPVHAPAPVHARAEASPAVAVPAPAPAPRPVGPSRYPAPPAGPVPAFPHQAPVPPPENPNHWHAPVPVPPTAAAIPPPATRYPGSLTGASAVSTAVFATLATLLSVVPGVMLILGGMAGVSDSSVLEALFIVLFGAAMATPGAWWWRCHFADQKILKGYREQYETSAAVNAAIQGTPDQRWASPLPQMPAPYERRWPYVIGVTAALMVVSFVIAGIAA